MSLLLAMHYFSFDLIPLLLPLHLPPRVAMLVLLVYTRLVLRYLVCDVCASALMVRIVELFASVKRRFLPSSPRSPSITTAPAGI